MTAQRQAVNLTSFDAACEHVLQLVDSNDSSFTDLALDVNGVAAYMASMISKFEHQLRVGCLDKSCTRSCCWSHRKASVGRPARPYTATTIRALACRLASRDDAKDLLCESSDVESSVLRSRSEKYDPSSMSQWLFGLDTQLGAANLGPIEDPLPAPSTSYGSVPKLDYKTTLAFACIDWFLSLTSIYEDGTPAPDPKHGDRQRYPFLDDHIGFGAHCCAAVFSDPRALAQSFIEPNNEWGISLEKFLPCSIDDIAQFFPLRPIQFRELHDENDRNACEWHFKQLKVDSALRWWADYCGPLMLTSLRTAISRLSANMSEYTFVEKRQCITLALLALNAYDPNITRWEVENADGGMGFASKVNKRHNCRAALMLTREIAALMASILSSPESEVEGGGCLGGWNSLFCSAMQPVSRNACFHTTHAYLHSPADFGRNGHHALWRTNSDGRSVALYKNLSLRLTEGLPMEAHLEDLPPMMTSLLTVDINNTHQAETRKVTIGIAPTAHQTSAWLVRAFRDLWDGRPSIKTPSTIADVLFTMDNMYRHDKSLPPLEQRAILSLDRPTPFELSNDFIDPPEGHWSLLYYTWCFPPFKQILNFRALCLTRMIRSWYDCKLQDDFLYHIFRWNSSIAGYQTLRTHVLRSAVCPQLTLLLDRDNLVQSAFDQLWHRDSKELLRPLKVKIDHAGEEGQDQGGPAQEFFLLFFAEVFKPEYGVFKIDTVTRMAWFNIACLEPSYKIEMIGILMALAVHNGFTLPLTLPAIFYEKLCQRESNTMWDVRSKLLDLDIFTEQANNLLTLLNMKSEEEVEALTLDYVFSFDFYDRMGVVDMLGVQRPELDDEEEGLRMVDDFHYTDEAVLTPITQDDGSNNDHKVKFAPVEPIDMDTKSPTQDAGEVLNSFSFGVDGVKSRTLSSSYAAPGSLRQSPDESSISSSSPSSPSTRRASTPPPSSLRAATKRPQSIKKQRFSVVHSLTNRDQILDTATAVTLANRDAFVEDYYNWLTTSSVHHLFTPLMVGFHRVISADCLCTVDPSTLRRLVEGSPEIDIASLKAITRYDGGYSAETPVIIDFWAVMSEYSSEQKALLLEFVTASHRIPATGYGSLQFVIQRAGPDTDRLPSASTCFGHLLLPEYDGREKLEAKLGVALENVVGFGSV